MAYGSARSRRLAAGRRGFFLALLPLWLLGAPVRVTLLSTGDLHEHSANLARIARLVRQRKAKTVLIWDDGRITHRQTRIPPITADLPEDPAAAAIPDKWLAGFPAADSFVRAPRPYSRREVTLWLADLLKERTGADLVLLPRELAKQGLPAGPVTPGDLLATIPRLGLVEFTVRPTGGLPALMAHLWKKRPGLLAYRDAGPAPRGGLRAVYPCVAYDRPLSPPPPRGEGERPPSESIPVELGFPSALVGSVKRLPDTSLWQVILAHCRQLREARQDTPMIRLPYVAP